MDHGAESKEMDMEKGNHDMHGVDHAKLDHAKISHDERNNENMHHEHREDGMDKGQTVMDHNKTNHGGHMSHAQMHGGGDRPMFATVTVSSFYSHPLAHEALSDAFTRDRLPYVIAVPVASLVIL